MKYESPTSYGSKVMAYIEFLGMKVEGHCEGHKVKSFGMTGKAS